MPAQEPQQFSGPEDNILSQAKLPIATEFQVFYSQVQALVRDNLAALLERTKDLAEKDKIMSYIETLQQFKSEKSNHNDLHFDSRTVFLVQGNDEKSKTDAASVLLQATVIYSGMKGLGRQPNLEDIAAVQNSSLEVSKKLMKLLKGKVNLPFALASEKAVETFDDMVQKYLEPTEEELEKINSAKELGRQQFQTELSRSGSQPSISIELRFLKTLFRDTYDKTRNIDLLGSKWTYFFATFNETLAIQDADKRREALTSQISDVINSLTIAYILNPKRKVFKPGEAVSGDDINKVISVSVECFRTYVLSKIHNRDVTYVHRELTEAAKLIQSKVNLYSIIRQGDPAKKFAAQIGSLRISEKEAELYQESQREKGIAANLELVQEIAKVAELTNSQLQLPGGGGPVLLLAGEVRRGREAGKENEYSELWAEGLVHEFNQDNGYLNPEQLRGQIAETVYKTKMDAIFFSFPDDVMENSLRAFMEDEGSTPSKACLWIKHLLGIYEIKDPTANFRSDKTLSRIWYEKCKAAGVFEKGQLNLSTSFLTPQEKERELNKADIAKAYFLAYHFVSVARFSPQNASSFAAKLGTTCSDLIQHSKLSTAVIRISEGMFKTLERIVPQKAIEAPESIQKSWGIFATKPEQSHVVAAENKERSIEDFIASLSIPRSLSFAGLIERAMGIGSQILSQLEKSTFEEQRKLAQILLAGDEDSAHMQLVFNEVFKQVHPDTLSIKWPDEKYHAPLTEISGALSKIRDQAAGSKDISGAELLDSVNRLVRAAVEFQAIDESIKISSQKQKEAKEALRAERSQAVLEEISGRLENIDNSLVKLFEEIAELKDRLNN